MTGYKNYVPNVAQDANVTIESGNTTSNAIDLSGNTLCGVYIPASFTGASISFECAKADGESFCQVKDGSGALVSKTVSAGAYTILDPSDFAGIRLLKIASASTEAASRIIALAARPV